jgi:hypothetical protein
LGEAPVTSSRVVTTYNYPLQVALADKDYKIDDIAEGDDEISGLRGEFVTRPISRCGCQPRRYARQALPEMSRCRDHPAAAPLRHRL